MERFCWQWSRYLSSFYFRQKWNRFSSHKLYNYYTQIGRYEKKGAQPSADILSKLANSLGVSSDFLINGTSDDLAESSLTDKELLNQFKAIEKMPERDKDVVKTLIDAFITKGKLKQLVL